jgi:hypothetical protein
MSASYLITKYDYETGKEDVQSIHTDKFNALNEIQSMVIEYIQKNDGIEKISPKSSWIPGAKCTDSKSLEYYIHSVKELGNGQHHVEKAIEAKSIGHYVVVDTDDHLHKWTVWQKYLGERTVNGWTGKYREIVPKAKKIFDLDVVQLPLDMFKILFKTYRQQYLGLFVDKLTLTPDTVNTSEAHDLWKTFTADVMKTSVFAALKDDIDSPKPTKLKVDFASEFHKYPKKIATPRKVSNVDPMYISMMEELTSASLEEEIIPSTQIPPKRKGLVPPPPTCIETQKGKGPNVLSMLHKKLANEAMDRKIKLRSNKEEKKSLQQKRILDLPDLSQPDEEYIKPPWMGGKFSS